MGAARPQWLDLPYICVTFALLLLLLYLDTFLFFSDAPFGHLIPFCSPRTLHFWIPFFVRSLRTLHLDIFRSPSDTCLILHLLHFGHLLHSLLRQSPSTTWISVWIFIFWISVLDFTLSFRIFRISPRIWTPSLLVTSCHCSTFYCILAVNQHSTYYFPVQYALSPQFVTYTDRIASDAVLACPLHLLGLPEISPFLCWAYYDISPLLC